MIMISSASAASVWDGKSVDTSWYDDSKREFTIDSAAQLAGVAALVNDGTTTFRDKTITLANDIDLNNHPWTPIGFGEDETLEIIEKDGVNHHYRIPRIFAGNFDGANHVVSNLYVSYPNQNRVGFFGYAGDIYERSTIGSSIGNLRVEATQITGRKNVGALVGSMINGDIKTISISVDEISGSHSVGGLVGSMQHGTIDDVTVMANTISGTSLVGGIVGTVDGPSNDNIDSTSHLRNIKVSVVLIHCSDYSAGGVVGQFEGYIENAEIYVDNINGIRQVGGIAGLSEYGIIQNCAVFSSIIGTQAGGIAGVLSNHGGSSSINNCYFVGSISGDVVSGITSYLDRDCKIENCYIVGTIVGNEPSTGGIVRYGGEDSHISNSVALIQYINSTSPNRIAGKFAHKTKLHNNYAWDEMMSFDTLITEDDDSTSSRNGASISSENIWGNQAFFERTLGWDFKNTWIMNSGNEKFNLPVLQFQEQPVNADAMYLYAEPVETPGFSPFLVILAFGLCIGLTTRRRK